MHSLSSRKLKFPKYDYINMTKTAAEKRVMQGHYHLPLEKTKKMRNILITLFTAVLWVSCEYKQEKQSVAFDSHIESAKILKTIDNWNLGWDSRNVELAIKDYSENTDWTNAFGDRVQSKEALRQLLSEIFTMDFVMAGKHNYSNDDVEFLNSEIALLRSTNIRTGQKWSDGSLMKDRHIHHLRVYQKTGNEWKIINHMISQANERN